MTSSSQPEPSPSFEELASLVRFFEVHIHHARTDRFRAEEFVKLFDALPEAEVFYHEGEFIPSGRLVIYSPVGDGIVDLDSQKIFLDRKAALERLRFMYEKFPRITGIWKPPSL